ncbi:unnamed protein product, partial [marine sediment metagenome]
VESRPAREAGAQNVHVRWLISDEDGAPNFCMRRFELAQDGSTPRHSHPWEHEVYILEGEGSVLCKGSWKAFRPGDVIYIPGEEEHSFRADRGCEVAFLCLIPKEGKQR